MMVMMIILAVLMMALLIISWIISEEAEDSDSKSMPFECGFTDDYSGRSVFSMRFFMLTIIFLVFDIELVLLMPYMVLGGSHWIVLVFLLILTGGALYELNKGALSWVF